MSTAKSMRIHHPTKGVIALGQMSKNELCRAVVEQSNRLQAFDIMAKSYSNYIATHDAYYVLK